ncbi:MAG: HlyD family efflux transporter periplasmic adaptor subunit, partial [Thermodesulfobacteriota bacterium]
KVQQAMTRAETNLQRCRVYAPFDCRITSKKIEKGQYVAPGKIVLGLADDSTLELEVGLDSRDAMKWLQFSETVESDISVSKAWFRGVKPVQCEVSWTEDPEKRAVATLDRVSGFDEKTRTLKVVLRVDSKQFSQTGLPLVAGMFCRTAIPGRTMRQVVAIPRWAVSFENTVYVVRDRRLHTTQVQVARVQDNKAYISKGLAEGDMVIVTRLVNPLERSLVKLMPAETGAGEK